MKLEHLILTLGFGLAGCSNNHSTIPRERLRIVSAYLGPTTGKVYKKEIIPEQESYAVMFVGDVPVTTTTTIPTKYFLWLLYSSKTGENGLKKVEIDLRAYKWINPNDCVEYQQVGREKYWITVDCEK